jgi:hypothetical protein
MDYNDYKNDLVDKLYQLTMGIWSSLLIMNGFLFAIPTAFMNSADPWLYKALIIVYYVFLTHNSYAVIELYLLSKEHYTSHFAKLAGYEKNLQNLNEQQRMADRQEFQNQTKIKNDKEKSVFEGLKLNFMLLFVIIIIELFLV